MIHTFYRSNKWVSDSHLFSFLFLLITRILLARYTFEFLGPFKYHMALYVITSHKIFEGSTMALSWMELDLSNIQVDDYTYRLDFNKRGINKRYLGMQREAGR